MNYSDNVLAVSEKEILITKSADLRGCYRIRLLNGIATVARYDLVILCALRIRTGLQRCWSSARRGYRRCAGRYRGYG